MPIQARFAAQREVFFHKHRGKPGFPLLQAGVAVKVELNSGNILIRKRDSGIWKSLYEFPNLISKKRNSEKSVLKKFIGVYKINQKISILNLSDKIKHLLSHKELSIQFYMIKFVSLKDLKEFSLNNNFNIVNKKELPNFPFPVVLKNYIEKYLV